MSVARQRATPIVLPPEAKKLCEELERQIEEWRKL